MNIYEYSLKKDTDNRLFLNVLKTLKCEHRLFNKPVVIEEFFNEFYDMRNLAEEYVYLVALTNKCECTGIFEISHGAPSASIVDMSNIFRRLLLTSATGFILLHNHPSGYCDPSQADLDIMKRVLEASKLLGFDFLDFIILGNDLLSFKENGLL